MEYSSQRWSWRQRVLWLLLACLVCWWRGPEYRRVLDLNFYPSGSLLFLPDYYQEWASARNRFQGLPIYTSQRVTLLEYLGLWHDPNDRFFIEFNAHPPSSVLLGMPFAGLQFRDAFVLWNALSLVFLVASIGIIVRQLRLPYSFWDCLPGITLMLLSHPFWHQMIHGQLNLLLLLLLTGAWAADRNGHPNWAGTFVALAVAIKLFPAFLFLYFLFRLEYSAIRTGLLVLVGITVVTALSLGPDTYGSYFLEVLPRTSQWRSEWPNLSLSGLWFKLFDSSMHLPPIEIQPLAKAPAIALLGMICTSLAVTAALTALAPRLRSIQDWDSLFALTTIGMLLVSPITWDHYLLLLVLPVAILWQRLPRGRTEREVLTLLLAVFWIEAKIVMEHGLILIDAARTPNAQGNWIATPLETLTARSTPCYALVGLFVLAILTVAKNRRGDMGKK